MGNLLSKRYLDKARVRKYKKIIGLLQQLTTEQVKLFNRLYPKNYINYDIKTLDRMARQCKRTLEKNNLKQYD